MFRIIFLSFASILIVPMDTATPPKPPREIAPYPPMHWHSWNTFCAEDMVNETNMREMADALIATGMVAAGYDTVNVVCNGWTGRHPVTKEFTENSTLWPNGIGSFADYLHKKGMRLGCYTSPATKNCCGEPGSLGFEYIDMEFFARVGCDHVMVDWCRGYNNPKDMKKEYAVIGAAIKNSSNPNMLYGIWPGGRGKSWKWASEVGGHYWRTASDIMNIWDSGHLISPGGVLHNFDTAYSIPDISLKTGPGRFTFLDQMVVGVAANGTGDNHHKGGVPGPGLNFYETQAHMSMWVMAASPLLTCNDVRNMSTSIQEILTNPEVLAVHKDPLAKMAVRIDVGGGVEEAHSSGRCNSAYSVYGRPLVDGSSAVMVLNRGTTNATVRIPAEDVGDSMHSTFLVRDLWEHRNLTMEVIARPTPRPPGYRPRQDTDMRASDDRVSYTYTSVLTLVVPPHGVRMLRMWPVSPPPPPQCPHGYTAHQPSGYWDNTDPCPHHDFHDCQEDSANATVPLCGSKCDNTPGCVAFEVFLGPRSGDGDANDACYIFLNKLTPPFTPNIDSFTCVRDL